MYNNNNNQGGYGGGGYNNGYGRNQGGGGGGYNAGYGANNNNTNNYNQGGGFGSGYNLNNPSNNSSYANGNNNYNSNVNNNNYDDDVSSHPEYQQTTQNIQQIQNAVTTLKKLAQLLGTPRDSVEVREKIRACIESTTRLIQSESNKVKTLTELSNRASQRNKLLYQKLVKEYNASLQSFKETAQSASNTEKSKPLAVQPSSLGNGNGFGGRSGGGGMGQGGQYPQQQQFNQYGQHPYFDDNRDDETVSLMEATKRQQLQQVENEREYHNAIIQERDEDIKQIEKSISEINDIFLDLSNMVGEQGVMLNNIENTLESTVHNTKDATIQIRQASEYQQSARSKMCWLALILLVVAAVLGIILFFTLKK